MIPGKAFKIPYQFKTEIWKYQGQAGWYFVTLPRKLSKEIRNTHKLEQAGWGRLPAEAQIGKQKWETAIWYDTKRDAYLLPIKVEIRRKENLDSGKVVEVNIFV